MPKKKSSAAPRAKRPTCHKCRKKIHVPKDWSVGPSVRTHYWKHHPEVMQPKRKNK